MKVSTLSLPRAGWIQTLECGGTELILYSFVSEALIQMYLLPTLRTGEDLLVTVSIRFVAQSTQTVSAVALHWTVEEVLSTHTAAEIRHC
jgi:hypothetical protein